MNSLKKRVNTILNGDSDNWWSINAKTIIAILVAINIAYVIFEPLNIFSNIQHILALLSYISATFFCVEYICRIWVSPLSYPYLSAHGARVKYIISFYGVVDFISIIPFIAPMLLTADSEISALINVSRIFLILKTIRYSKAFSLLRSVVKEAKQELLITLSLSASVIIFSALVMYYVERGAQPDVFYNTGQGLWWAIVTFATVGYGDIYPITPLGKILASAISLVGIGLIALPTAILSSSLMSLVAKRKAQNIVNEQQGNYCSHCGKALHDNNNKEEDAKASDKLKNDNVD